MQPLCVPNVVDCSVYDGGVICVMSAITIILYYYRYYRTVVNILHNKRSKIPSKYHSEISRNSHKFKEVGPVHMSVLGPSMALAGLGNVRGKVYARPEFIQMECQS